MDERVRGAGVQRHCVYARGIACVKPVADFKGNYANWEDKDFLRRRLRDPPSRQPIQLQLVPGIMTGQLVSAASALSRPSAKPPAHTMRGTRSSSTTGTASSDSGDRREDSPPNKDAPAPSRASSPLNQTTSRSSQQALVGGPHGVADRLRTSHRRLSLLLL